MLACRSPILLLALALAGMLHCQTVAQRPDVKLDSGKRTWSLFTEYSPGSSHIILGYSRQREFVAFGVGFTQKFFESRFLSLAYRAEIRPVMVESDPVLTGDYYNINLPAIGQDPPLQASGYYHLPHKEPVISAAPKAVDYSFTYQGQTYYQDYTLIYGRRWTYAGGLNPAGLQAKFLPRSRIQPELSLMTGFTVSTRDIPVFNSSAFNLTFSVGAGFDLLHTPGRSVRLEYRIQHLSNADLHTSTDPGIDSQFIHVGYNWGR
ncbi:MAG: acyloxyacyl hydrolase [Acidobacteriaceae bacterium]|nr:acyloxyacyl hydrolase [Acidobacteriaceae bacterium]